MMATQKQVADHLDLSDRHLRRLIETGVLAPQSKGGRDLAADRIAYIRHLRDSASNSGSSLDLSIERARQAKETADKLALENAVSRGELVELAEIQSEWKREVISAKNLLLGIPTRVAPLIAVEGNPAVCRDIVKRVINEALDELSADPEAAGVVDAPP